jgi:hypothetical protein
MQFYGNANGGETTPTFWKVFASLLVVIAISAMVAGAMLL